MFKNLSDQIGSLRLLSIMLSVVAALFLASYVLKFLYLFSDIILVLLLSWLISFLFEPLLERLIKMGVSRLGAAFVIYGVFTVFIVGLFILAVPIIVAQINNLLTLAPTFNRYIPGWANRILDVSFSVLENSVTIAGRVASFLFYFFFILFLSFYLLLDKQKIWQWFLLLVPNNYHKEVEYFRGVIDNTFAGFIRVQVVLGIIFGLIVFIFLQIFVPSFALVAGFLSAVLTVIPIIGPLLGLLPPFIAGLTLGLPSALWLTFVIFIIQQVELNILATKLWGRAMRIHPVVVLLSFLVGLKVAGVWGSIFAVPLASILVIIGSELVRHYRSLDHTEPREH
ncbi:MAG: AI-2E family transporter [Patescibacteria group bacterium]|nr:AI-2E family transporter [Patescibacteria group bacterium]